MSIRCGLCGKLPSCWSMTHEHGAVHFDRVAPEYGVDCIGRVFVNTGKELVFTRLSVLELHHAVNSSHRKLNLALTLLIEDMKLGDEYLETMNNASYTRSNE